MIKAVIFDLDGTLLPMKDERLFVKTYLNLISNYMEKYGYEKNALMKNIFNSTEKMNNGDGTKTCEELFWEYFTSIYGKEKLNDKKHFDEFYTSDFKKTKAVCEENPYAKTIIDFCKSNGLKIVLATSPYFPKNSMITRIEFVGLKESDFDYITSYENCYYSKSNPNFYNNILKNLNLKPDEVVMFGNNTIEDGEIPNSIGIKPYLIKETLSNNNENCPYDLINFNLILTKLNKILNK